MEGKIDSPIIIPRNYCLCYEKGPIKTYLAPFYHIQGIALVTPPETLEKRARFAQKYNRRYKELENQGNPPYKPKLFPWTDEMLEDKNIFESFREAVWKEEGAYTLVDATQGEAILDFKLMGRILTGRVKSKEPRVSAKRSQTHVYYNTSIENIFLDEYGEPDLLFVFCSCPGHSWTEPKGSNFLSVEYDTHPAALEQAFTASVFYPHPMKKGPVIGNVQEFRKGKRRGIFSPFSFSSNWRWDEESRRYISVDKDLQVMEEDARFAHYILKIPHFEINRRATSQPKIFSAVGNTLLDKGLLTFEVLAQKTKRVEPIARGRAMNRVFEKALKILASYKYVPDGKYLELGRSAWRYRHGDNVIGIVFSEDIPPFYVIRHGFDVPVKPWAEDHGETDPFKLVGMRDQYRIDDKTRKLTFHTVEPLSDLRLPETGYSAVDLPSRELKSWFKETIRKSDPEGADDKLRHSRMLF